MVTVKLDEETLIKVERNVASFKGNIIDISGAPDSLSSHLNISLAHSCGVTQKELSVQIAEDRIRKVASAAKILVIAFYKEQVEQADNLLEELRVDKIILLK